MKILLAEDDPMIAEIYERKFKDAGFEVFIAASGSDVLRHFQSENPDLVLLDLVLPDMSGFDVLKKIKQNKNNPKTKVIIFSNLNAQEEQNAAFELGADGYISKTQFNPSELVNEIRWRMNIFKEQKKNGESADMGKEAALSVEKSDKKRILFIEDEDVFLEIFGSKLEKEGYEVEYAKNGSWGLKEAMLKNFDLIIMDVVMPAMNGREVVEKLKMEEKTKKIPIIILSASADDKEKNQIEKMGVHEFLVKTHIVPSELCVKVKNLIG